LATIASHRPEGHTEWLFGNYRVDMIQAGAFEVLLTTLETVFCHRDAAQQIRHSASIAIMYLSSAVTGEISASSLCKLIDILAETYSKWTLLHLVTGLRLLLHQPEYSKAACTGPFKMSRKARGEGSMKLVSRRCRTSKIAPMVTKERADEMEALSKGENYLADVEEDGNSILKPKGTLTKNHSTSFQSPTLENVFTEVIDNSVRKPDLGANTDTDWGLGRIIFIGNKWYSQMASCENSLDPVVGMFNSLAPILWLYIIGDNDPPPPRRRDLSELDHPKGFECLDTWWTVAVAGSEEQLPSQKMTQVVDLLLRILSLKHRAHGRAVMWSLGLLWVLSGRSQGMETYLIQKGVAEMLIDILLSEQWQHGVKDYASGLLGALMDEWSNVENMGSSLQPALAALARQLQSPSPRVYAAALRVMGHMTYVAPLFCPDSQLILRTTKATLIELESMELASKVLQKSFKHFLQHGEPEGAAAEATWRPLGAAPGMSAEQYNLEVDVLALPPQSQIGDLAVMWLVLVLLRNISVCSEYQVRVAKTSLLSLLQINSHFTGILSATPSNRNAMHKEIVDLCSATLRNLSSHPDNRTRFYKTELRGMKGALERGSDASNNENLGAGAVSPSTASMLLHDPESNLRPPPGISESGHHWLPLQSVVYPEDGQEEAEEAEAMGRLGDQVEDGGHDPTTADDDRGYGVRGTRMLEGPSADHCTAEATAASRTAQPAYTAQLSPFHGRSDDPGAEPRSPSRGKRASSLLMTTLLSPRPHTSPGSPRLHRPRLSGSARPQPKLPSSPREHSARPKARFPVTGVLSPRDTSQLPDMPNSAQHTKSAPNSPRPPPSPPAGARGSPRADGTAEMICGRSAMAVLCKRLRCVETRLLLRSRPQRETAAGPLVHCGAGLYLRAP
ncbi:hypothetical protein CYMTET_3770, partial [Cymbomonas tetramitiformis]